MILVGAGLSLGSKVMIAGTGAVYAGLGGGVALTWVAVAKVCDKISKGVRDTPLKALLSKEAGEYRTAAFGLKNSIAALGMAIGSLAAAQVFFMTGRSFEATFLLSAVPAAIALLLLWTTGPKEGDGEEDGGTGARPAEPEVRPPTTLAQRLQGMRESLAGVARAVFVEKKLSAPFWKVRRKGAAVIHRHFSIPSLKLAMDHPSMYQLRHVCVKSSDLAFPP